MEKEMSRKNKTAKKYRSPGIRRAVWWISSVILLALVVMGGSQIWKKSSAASGSDLSKVMGRWGRLDGGYVLELSSPEPNGVLKASYFNPRPINVSRAEWKQQDGVPSVFVELRDTGYPGSTYTLSYQPVEDQLVGSYFQAAIGQQFGVAFKRSK